MNAVTISNSKAALKYSRWRTVHHGGAISAGNVLGRAHLQIEPALGIPWAPGVNDTNASDAHRAANYVAGKRDFIVETHAEQQAASYEEQLKTEIEYAKSQS